MKSFTDPITGAMLEATDTITTDVPPERLWWGRRLGYTDEQVRAMWLKDARRPRYLNVAEIERVMNKQEAEHFERRRLMTGQ